MINSKLLLLPLIFLLISCVYKKESSVVIPIPMVQITEEEYNNVINQEYSHKLVKQVLKDSIEYNVHKNNHALQLFKKVELAIKKSKKSKAEILLLVRERIKKENLYIEDFNKNISTYESVEVEKINELNKVLEPVKANKLNLFLEHILSMDDNELYDIIYSKKKNKLFQNTHLSTFLINNADDRSNKTIPSVIIIMLATLSELDLEKYNQYKNQNTNNNALFYWYQTPVDTNIDYDSLFYSRQKEKNGLIIVHNGYAFGDSIRSENFTDDNFLITPHDCAGYLNHIAKNGKNPCTNNYNILWTRDILNLHRFLTNSKKATSLEEIKEKLWLYGEFAAKFQPIEINKIEDIKEGDIVLYRRFADSKQSKNDTLGLGGHVGVVFKTDNADKVYMASYTRNYEDLGIGGFLIGAFSFKIMSSDLYSIIGFRMREECAK